MQQSEPRTAQETVRGTVPESAEDDRADEALRYWFDGAGPVAVAFSGGVDSALVAWYACQQLGPERCGAWIADTPSLKRADLAAGQAFCVEHGIPLTVMPTAEIDDPAYSANDIDRCYHCKSTLYDTLVQTLRDQAPADCCICSGANADDLGDYRPGLQAAAERAVRHPLVECGIGKAQVRALARRHGLACWDKPAAPCLSSRIPYGEAVTRAKLARIEAAEAWLLDQGFPVCRVRHRGADAMVEVPPQRLDELQTMAPAMQRHFAGLGFVATHIDAEGFVSGKLNRGVVQ